MIGYDAPQAEDLHEILESHIRAIFVDREETLWHFAVSGAFINELMQMEQPSLGRWWVQ